MAKKEYKSIESSKIYDAYNVIESYQGIGATNGEVWTKSLENEDNRRAQFSPFITGKIYLEDDSRIC